MPRRAEPPQGNTHRIIRWLGASCNQRQQRMRVPSAYQPTIRKLMEAKSAAGLCRPGPFCADGQYFDIDETYCRVMTTLDKAGQAVASGVAVTAWPAI